MGVNPISYQEIEAFCRLCLVDLTAWEVDLLVRLDDAAIRAINGEAPKPPPKTDEPLGPIPVSDVKAIKGLFRGIAASRAASKAAETPSKGGPNV
jgi:hypothetical protein